jgi:hypothetical protein
MVMITDLVDPQELLGYTRAAQIEAERNRFTLSNFLPNDTTPDGDIEFRLLRGSFRDEDAAKVRAWDSEAPISGRQGIERIMGELLPVSQKIRLGEEERLRNRGLVRGLSPANNTALVDAIFNDAAKMARAVAARFELFRGEVLEKATVTINENGVAPATIDFGRKAGHTVVLAGNALWSNYVTPTISDPVANMRTWVQAYIDTNGVTPAFALTSTTVISTLMQHPLVRVYAAGVGGTPGLITVDTLNAIMVAFGLPPFVPYDAVIRVAGVQTRPIAATKVILMPPSDEPLGATLFGTTAEALELAEAQLIAQDQAPGMVSVPMKEMDPVATWTLATAVGFPVLANPDLTFTATVL